MATEVDIARDLEEVNELAEDVFAASYHVFDNALRRCLAPLHPGAALGAFVDRMLPEIDFDQWYAEAKRTVGSMVGSGSLEWPIERPARIAMQLALLRRVTAGEIQLSDFTAKFLYVSSRLDDNLRAFVQQVFRPFLRDLNRVVEALLERPEMATAPIVAEPVREAGRRLYVDPERIESLRQLSPPDYDLRRLIRMCEELNIAHHNDCRISVAMLVRAIMDHVPPIFDAASFSHVANNYAGAKSFRESMQHLSGSARKIGDAYLHVQVRSREALPTETQVNFSNDLDTLLAEVVRILS